jgi:hypothetical protein
VDGANHVDTFIADAAVQNLQKAAKPLGSAALNG